MKLLKHMAAVCLAIFMAVPLNVYAEGGLDTEDGQQYNSTTQTWEDSTTESAASDTENGHKENTYDGNVHVFLDTIDGSWKDPSSSPSSTHKNGTYIVTIPTKIAYENMNVGKVNTSDKYTVNVIGALPDEKAVRLEAETGRIVANGTDTSAIKETTFRGKRYWKAADLYGHLNDDESLSGTDATDYIQMDGEAKTAGQYEGSVLYTASVIDAADVPAEDKAEKPISPQTALKLTSVNFNGTIKSLAGDTKADNQNWEDVSDSAITSILMADALPSDTSKLINIAVDGNEPIYVWFDNGIIYYHTDAEKIVMPADMNSMFQNLTACTKIDTLKWDTSNATSIQKLFENDKKLSNVDLSNMNVSNVQHFAEAFWNTSSFSSIDVSTWNTSKALEMSKMFGCGSTEWNLGSITFGSGWNTSNVTVMNGMFMHRGNLLSLDCSGWNTSKVTTMESMFQECYNMNSLKLDGWDTSHVANMVSMLNHIAVKELDLSSFSAESLNNSSWMFCGDSNLTTIYTTDKFDLSDKNISCEGMFGGAGKIVGGNGTVYDGDIAWHTNAKSYARIDGKDGTPGWFTIKDPKNSIVTFDANNGTGKVTNMTVSGSSFSMPKCTFTYDGKVFAGWAKDKDNRWPQLFYPDSKFTNTGSNVTYYARWVDDITITFHPHEMEGTAFTKKLSELSSDGRMQMPACPFTGGIFINWQSRPDGDGVGRRASADGIYDDYVYYTGIYPDWYAFSENSYARMRSGENVNSILKKLAGHANDNNYYNDDTIITSFARVYDAPDSSVMNDDHDISYYDQAYAWIDNGAVKVYKANNAPIYLSMDSSSMFRGMKSLKSVDLTGFQITGVENLHDLFYDDSSLETVMIPDQKTESLKDVRNMFAHTGLKEFAFPAIDTSNVTSANTMFNGNSNLTTLDMSNFSNAGLLKEMNCYSMFSDCPSLTTIKVSDKWQWPGRDKTVPMFNNSDKLIGGADTANADPSSVYARIDCGAAAPGYFTGRSTVAQSEAVLDTGPNVNTKLMSLNGIENAAFFTQADSLPNTLASNAKQNLFRRLMSAVTPGIKTVNLSASGEPVYAWVDGNKAYWYTEATKITMPADSSVMFKGLTNAERIEVGVWDTSNIENASSMFENDQKITENLLSIWNSKNLTNMHDMFKGCTKMNYSKIDRCDLSHVTDMSGLFENNEDFVKFYDGGLKNTLALTDTSNMFKGCSSYTGEGIGSLDTANITDMSGMFEGDTNIPSVNITAWDVSTVKNADNMFNGCANIAAVYSDKDFSSLTSAVDMFKDCDKLKGGNGTTVTITDGSMAKIDKSGQAGYLTDSNTRSFIAGNGRKLNALMKIIAGKQNANEYTAADNIKKIARASAMPLGAPVNTADASAGSIVKISEDYGKPCYMWFDTDTLYWYSAADKLTLPADSSDMFGYFTAVQTIDTQDFDTTGVYRMNSMFNDCCNLNNPDVSDWNVSNVRDFSWLFTGCSAISSLNLDKWDTGNATDMAGMFSSCDKLAKINLTGFNTSHVKRMRNMFYNDKSLKTLNLNTWDTHNVNDMSGMFNYCTSLTDVDIADFDTSGVTDMSNMFAGAQGQHMALKSIDVSKWDVSKVANFSSMFQDCYVLSALDVSKWDTSSAEYMGWMFYECEALGSLDVSNFKTDKVIVMSHMFCRCQCVPVLDVSKWNVSNCKHMNNMFNGCSWVQELPVQNWNVSNVEDMDQMFKYCSRVTEIPVGNWKTTNLKKAWGIFWGCSHVTSLDVNGWDVSHLTVFSEMFNDCESLTSLDLNNWNTSNAKYMGYCKITDYSMSWDGSVYEELPDYTTQSMFQNCFNLETVDLSSFDTSNVVSMNSLFAGCHKLKTVYVGQKWSTVNIGTDDGIDGTANVFANCESIVGGNGTTYDSSKTGSSMAVADINAHHGYLTLK